MAGFLRKKSKQEPQPKAAPIHSQAGNAAPSSTPTPLFARFASTSSSQNQQEPPRIVSSPMLLSSGPRKGGIPVNHMQNRGERVVAGNNSNSPHGHGGRGDVRDVDTRSQRAPPYMAERLQEKPRNATIEARPQQYQPLAAQQQPKVRPVSRVLMFDKPLPPSLPPTQPDTLNPHTHSSNGIGAYHTPPQPQHTQEFAGEHSWATPSLQQNNKPLPQPTNMLQNSRPIPRRATQTSDPATFKHNRTFSVTSPNNPPPTSPPRRLMSTQATSYTQPPPSRAQKAQPSLPPAVAHASEARFDPDHAALHSQTLMPQPSNRDLHQQPTENDTRSDNSGGTPGRTTPAPDPALARQYSALLEVAFGDQSMNGGYQRQSSYSPLSGPARSENYLPDPVSSSSQEPDPVSLPSPSSPPTTHRKPSRLNAKGQGQPQISGPQTRLSVAYAESPAAAPHQPLPPHNRRSYHAPPDNNNNNNMGVNISSFDVSALPSYKNVPSNGNGHAPFPQHRAPLPPPSVPGPVTTPSPAQRYTPKQTAIPPRTSASMSIRSVEPPAPPVPGKPLIFAAMAAIDHEDPGTPDRRSVSIEPVSSSFPSFSSSPSPQPPHPLPQQAYPSPPAEFSFPPKAAPRPPVPAQFSGQNGHVRNPSAGVGGGMGRNEMHGQLHALPTPPTQHAPAPQKLTNNFLHSRPQSQSQSQQQLYPPPSSSPPKPGPLHTPHMGGPRPLSSEPQQQQQQNIRHSPTRTRKLSKARVPGTAQGSSDFSTHSTHSIHSHTSSMSMNTGGGGGGGVHRSPGKPRPITPVTRVSPPVVEDDGVGVPLDDDPFAMVEGVRLLGPTTTTAGSRAGSPEKDKDGTIKGRRSRGQLPRDGASEDFHSASEGESLNPSQRGQTSIEALPSTSSTKTARPRTSEGRKVSPPVVSGADQTDRLTAYLGDPHLLASLLSFLSFYEWCMVLSLSREVRYMLVQNAQLREEVLERFLRPVGYVRWGMGIGWEEGDPVSLSLQDLSDYMRGVSTPTHEYSRVAALYVHSLSIHPSHRDPALYDTVNQLAAATRAYTRVVLRLRAQAEKEASLARARGGGRAGSRPPSRAPSPTMSSTFSHSNHSYSSPPPLHRASIAAAGAAVPPNPTPPGTSAGGSGVFSSPLFRLRRAPLLRVFVPSPDGDWLSDKSVLECEAECRRAGVAHLMRVGDVVWDVAVGDEGNVGRLVWDGSYLLDLDYMYTPIGDLPKYMPTLAFPPSYFHRVIRTGASSSNPIVHIDLRPWGEEIAMNLQLLQDRMRTETPQGAYHNVVRWVHRSSFTIRPHPRGGAVRTFGSPQGARTAPAPIPGRIPIPDSNGLYVDAGWYGTIVVETEGTNEALADLQERCGPGAFPPRARGVNGLGTTMDRESRKVFRILREKSRPGEIWIKAVSAKERLL
ncbi:hypothetical protein BDZ94DRAFT_1315717 [Collybia nuda]|uniref:Uncharacterized protein n=1 Tax=Collybia nuda TaxID=64659 RepID=A0A9P6CBB5_9AGAR|nr:hypothetical protein BDZ94DRAFT_1315717 [Collybia nuda]